ncbi:MAG: VCBS repeat-containing protein [Gemmataceae bacterium]
MRYSIALVLAGAAVCGLACRKPPVAPPADEAAPWFADVTARVGLDFTHDPGPIDGKYFMPQSVGSGAALFDFDGDGRLDLYLLNNGGPRGKPNRLFRQQPDGTFTDVSQGSGLDFSGYCMGVAVGDVNNDGRPDVLVTRFGGVNLFLNQGGGRFTDVTRAVGLDNPAWGTSAAFLDHDRDGWLDLVVVNYVDYDPSIVCQGAGRSPDYCHPNGFLGNVTRLFHNRGKGADGKWRGYDDVSLRSGIGKVIGPGLGVACADFDGDGWPDILVANDAKPNRLWINQKDGTFVDEAVQRGIAFNILGQAQANMGVAIGDVDGDGLFDVFITHLSSETHTLWRQGPRGFFRDESAASGVLATRWRGTGWGVALVDFDHDGSLDLAFVNGGVSRGTAVTDTHLPVFWRPYAQRNQLFANGGKGRFQDISESTPDLCALPEVSRGLAVGDVDGDGALDLLVSTIGGPARLLSNLAGKNGNWLLVRVMDPALNRDAYGAEVTVTTGGQRRVGWVNPAELRQQQRPPCPLRTGRSS